MSVYIHLEAAGKTDVGLRRKNNEDASLLLPEHGVFLVADGMGGGEEGEFASQTAVEEVSACFHELGEKDLPLGINRKIKLLRVACNRACQKIQHRLQSTGAGQMGSTMVAVLFDAAQPERLAVLHAGDSRAYLVHGGNLRQVSKDHSVSSAVGVQSDEDLPAMFRGMLTRALGLKNSVDLEKTEVTIEEGDLILLCSDGLDGMVPDAEIQGVFTQHPKGKPEEICLELVDAALKGGGRDNVTTIVIQVGKLPEPCVVSEIENEDLGEQDAGCRDEAMTEMLALDDSSEITSDTYSDQYTFSSDSHDEKPTATGFSGDEGVLQRLKGYVQNLWEYILNVPLRVTLPIMAVCSILLIWVFSMSLRKDDSESIYNPEEDTQPVEPVNVDQGELGSDSETKKTSEVFTASEQITPEQVLTGHDEKSEKVLEDVPDPTPTPLPPVMVEFLFEPVDEDSSPVSATLVNNKTGEKQQVVSGNTLPLMPSEYEITFIRPGYESQKFEFPVSDSKRTLSPGPWKPTPPYEALNKLERVLENGDGSVGKLADMYVEEINRHAWEHPDHRERVFQLKRRLEAWKSKPRSVEFIVPESWSARESAPVLLLSKAATEVYTPVKIRDELKLQPGTYPLLLKVPGYQEWTKSITVGFESVTIELPEYKDLKPLSKWIQNLEEAEQLLEDGFPVKANLELKEIVSEELPEELYPRFEEVTREVDRLIAIQIRKIVGEAEKTGNWGKLEALSTDYPGITLTKIQKRQFVLWQSLKTTENSEEAEKIKRNIVKILSRWRVVLTGDHNVGIRYTNQWKSLSNEEYVVEINEVFSNLVPDVNMCKNILDSMERLFSTDLKKRHNEYIKFLTRRNTYSDTKIVPHYFIQKENSILPEISKAKDILDSFTEKTSIENIDMPNNELATLFSEIHSLIVEHSRIMGVLTGRKESELTFDTVERVGNLYDLMIRYRKSTIKDLSNPQKYFFKNRPDVLLIEILSHPVFQTEDAEGGENSN